MINPKEYSLSIHSELNNRFFLYCITCQSVLMKLDEDPSSNNVLKRVAENITKGHVHAYHQPHQVELIDQNKNCSTTYLNKEKNILVSPSLDKRTNYLLMVKK